MQVEDRRVGIQDVDSVWDHASQSGGECRDLDFPVELNYSYFYLSYHTLISSIYHIRLNYLPSYLVQGCMLIMQESLIKSHMRYQ